VRIAAISRTTPKRSRSAATSSNRSPGSVRATPARADWLSPDGRAGLARALAIIDLSAEGEQPMFDADRELVIVFMARSTTTASSARDWSAGGRDSTRRPIPRCCCDVPAALRADGGAAAGMFTFANLGHADAADVRARDPYGINRSTSDDGRTIPHRLAGEGRFCRRRIPRTRDVAERPASSSSQRA